MRNNRKKMEKVVPIRISRDLWAVINKMASLDGYTPSAWIRAAAIKELRSRGKFFKYDAVERTKKALLLE